MDSDAISVESLQTIVQPGGIHFDGFVVNLLSGYPTSRLISGGNAKALESSGIEI